MPTSRIAGAKHARAKMIPIVARADDTTTFAPSLTDESLAIDATFELRFDPVEEDSRDDIAAASRNKSAAPDATPLVRRRDAPRYLRSHKRQPRLPDALPKPPRRAPRPARHALTGYYISRDTIYGPERSGEFYVRGERIYLSRRALGTRADIPGAAARELGRVLGDLAGLPRASGTVANRVAGREIAPIPTGYFTINGQIYGGMGRASDAIAGAGVRDVSAQLAKGEFRIIGNLIYGPVGRRVPWLTAIAPSNDPPTRARRKAA